jgi:hypothetical protein
MEPDMRETLDIAYVRCRTNSAHVSDEDALAAFSDGRGIFDVDPHCRKLDAFVAKHRIEVEIYSEALLPCADPQIENRPVYFGRARWLKRSVMGPGQAA